MSATLDLEIDGQSFPARADETILEVARRQGIFIPALCAHPLLKPYGACRLCLVEIQHHQHTRLVAACAYPAQAGLVVRTATPAVQELRRGLMELLLARCPDSAPVRELAQQLGVRQSRFPTLSRAGENCVLCGLCVRVCHEIIGASAISFAYRGIARCVDSPFSLGAEDCLGCCACAVLCPTGAISVRYQADSLTLLPFKITVPLGHCVLCGKPVAPSPLLALVKSQTPLPVAAGHLCADCKTDRHAHTLAHGCISLCSAQPRSAGVPPAGSGGVPPPGPTPVETTGQPAGETPALHRRAAAQKSSL